MSSLLEQVEETQHSETPVPTQDVHEYYVKNHAPTTPIHTPDDHEQYVEKHGPTLDRVIDKIKIGICVHVGTYAYEDWYRLSTILSRMVQKAVEEYCDVGVYGSASA